MPRMLAVWAGALPGPAHAGAGAMIAAAANGAFLGHTANTAGLHDLTVFAVVVAALMLALTLADRSLGSVGRTPVGEVGEAVPARRA